MSIRLEGRGGDIACASQREVKVSGPLRQCQGKSALAGRFSCVVPAVSILAASPTTALPQHDLAKPGP
jgi:hypothetical protein